MMQASRWKEEEPASYDAQAFQRPPAASMLDLKGEKYRKKKSWLCDEVEKHFR